MSERVVICGSRDFADLDRVREFVRSLPSDATVIVGGARGPDWVAEEAAHARGLNVERFPALWAKYGRAAGMRRNADMLDANPTRVVAFYDGASKGTAMMIRESRKRGIQLEVHEERGRK